MVQGSGTGSGGISYKPENSVLIVDDEENIGANPDDGDDKPSLLSSIEKSVEKVTNCCENKKLDAIF